MEVGEIFSKKEKATLSQAVRNLKKKLIELASFSSFGQRRQS